MSEKNLKISYLMVGLTVLIGLIIFFLFIFLVGTGGNYFADTYELKILVQDVQGLTEGNLVSLGGIKIGTVNKIKFNSDKNNPGINIDLEILSKYQNQITKNSTAEIKTIGLLGDKFVDISLATNDGQYLKNGDYLNFSYSLTISDISKQLEPAITNFVDVMENLRLISDSISEGNGSLGQFISDTHFADDLSSIIRDLKSFTHSLQSKEGTIGKLAYSDSVYNELFSLSRNFKIISQSIADGKGSLGKLVTTDSLYNNLTELSSNLNKISIKLNSDSSIVGGFINSNKMYMNFQNLINDIDSLSVDLKNNPGRYIQFSVF